MFPPRASHLFLGLALLLADASLLAAQETAPVPTAIPAPPAPAASRYHLTDTWKPPGDDLWRSLAIDSMAHRLYVVRQDRVQVLDSVSGEPVGEIKDLPEIRGLALAPRLGRGFVTSSTTDKLLIFDLKTCAPVGEPVPVGAGPTTVVYVPGRDKVFVFNVSSTSATVLDARDGKTLDTVPLNGVPESAVAEGGGRVFVNLLDTNEVLAIDAETHRVENRYKLKTAHGPTGLSLDPDGGRLFVSCADRKLVVMATEDGTVMSTLTVGAGAEATAFDNRTKLAFCANSTDGTVTLIDAYKANPKVVETLPTRHHASALAVDGRTHTLYVPAADFVETNLPPNQPPTMIPGSFVILKYDYDGPRK